MRTPSRVGSRSLHAALLLAAAVSHVGCATARAQAPAGARPHAGMMRYPHVSATQIVFVYGGDLWLVSRDGGAATRLSSPAGEEMFPRFSPDGATIAFMGNYDGNVDLYTIPATGGAPSRVTYHPAGELLHGWTPDGGLLFSHPGLGGLTRQTQLFTVPASGGLPTQLPVPYGANGAISPDGEWLAYTPHSVDMRTWKRYRGGMQTDIWLFNLKTHEAKQATDWEGVDSQPMWAGKELYYLSDQGPEHRSNLWHYNPANGQRRQVTKFDDFDVKWPSIGGGAIVFQLGAKLMLLDLKTEKSRAVDVTIPGDLPRIRPQAQPMSDMIRSFDISPTGKRVAVEARGDVFTLPAKEGSARNLTRSSGANERNVAWSPDGKWIAYFSDETGEYEAYLRPADGGEAQQLTRGGKTFYNGATWSPDSKHVVFGEKTGAIHLYTLESKALATIDTDPQANTPGVSWSHDSDWIAYARNGDNLQSSIWLYQLSTGAKHQVTSGRFSDSSPTFDRKGDFLYYASARDFNNPTYEDLGTTFVYADTSVLLAVPLRKDVKSPLLPKSDEEEPKKSEEKASSSQPATDSAPASASAPASESAPATASASAPASSKPADEKKPLVIDLAGFEARAIQLPVSRGGFGGIAVNSDGHLLYVRFPRRGSEGNASLRILDLSADAKEEKTVADNVRGFGLSADGKKVLVIRGGAEAYVVDAKADQKLDKRVPTDQMRTEIDPRAEWRQILREAWRMQRDFFYDPHMHNVDWDAVYKQYEPMLADCVSRADVSYIIREMISELNVGHAYYFGADPDSGPSVAVGMLGCDYALENGAYRIKTIHRGADWDSDARGPLSEPGIDAKEGDYLLAVNGAPVDARRAPWAALVGLADKVVTLTLSEKPTLDDSARKVVVKTISNEANLRYRAWIERKRAYVAEKTGGKVGYIYVPNTGRDGQNDLFRQFYGQIDAAALIIDERWNGGGQIPTRFIELLNRPVTNYWALRDGKDWTWPPDSHQGPKCMLINGLAGSGGDMFPWLFRYNNLGKLIGTRTWGGLVGISGQPNLIDGATVTVPAFAFYEKDGTWGVEGHGVDPDIEVIDDPSKMLGGGDPQLDAAIALMLREIETSGYKRPARPAYPDRKGMGIKPDDK